MVSKLIVCIFALIGLATPFLPLRIDESNRDCFENSADLAALQTATKMFSMQMGRFPTSEEGLSVLVLSESSKKLGDKYSDRGYIEYVPKDPWGNEYQYLVLDDGQKAIIWSGLNEACMGVNFVREVELFSAGNPFP